MKKIFNRGPIQTCLLAALLALPAVAQAQFGYMINNGGTIIITNYTGPGGAVTIPSVIIGRPVTSIGYQAFWENDKLTSVTIPDSVTSIGDFAFGLCIGMTIAILGNNITNIGGEAFGGTGLTSLKLPENLQVIGGDAFFNCKGLTSVVIPNSVTSVGAVAFGECPVLTNVDIGDGVTNIEFFAFEGCHDLANVKIGRSVAVIAGGAFEGCNNLTSITIPDNVLDIQGLDTDNGVYGAFAGCSGLTNISIGQGVTNIGAYAFAGCASLITIVIPDRITNIGDEVFQGCGLANVTIPNSVISIGSLAFSFCPHLTNVMIPKNVISIGYGTFNDCSSLTAITVDADNPDYSSVNGVLFNKSQSTLIEYPNGRDGSYAIPDDASYIGEGAFEDCAGLVSVTFPPSIVVIADADVVDGVAGAFSGCISLTNVAIGSNVTNIGEYAFASCPSLRTVSIPDSVISIGQQAFAYCFSLTAITVDTNNPAYSSVNGVLFDKSRATLLEYPGGLGGSYTVPDSVTSIGFQAFVECASLTNVTIGHSVTNIRDGAFFGCDSLTSIYFKDNAPAADGSVFGNTYDNPGHYFVTAYYLPGTTGWTVFSANTGIPALPWKPLIPTCDASFGARTNQFGFNIAWASGKTVVVEACTNLHNPVWSPVATNTLAGDLTYFSDPQWTNHPARFYRLRLP